MRVRVIVAAALVAAATAALQSPLQAGERTSSVWDGVYTPAQASRGQSAFTAHCAACHGADLAGVNGVPPLAGKHFLFNWSGQPAADLVDRIQTTMPADQPGSLSRTTVLDIVAYLFSANQFPGGRGELPDNAAALRDIQIDAAKPGKP